MKKNLTSVLLIIFSVSFFCYLLFKSEITFKGENRDYYQIYIIISLFIIFFSVLTLFLSRKIKTYFFIIFSTLLITIYVFEGYLILFENTKINFVRTLAYKLKTGNDYDIRSKFEIYNDIKKNNLKATVTASPANLLMSNEVNLFRLAGKSNSETIYCNENGYYSIYTSDRYGFNNPDKEWDSPEIEFLLIGDSFAHGACVNRPNDIASRLREITKKKVINLGYGGNGPLLEYATLKEYSPKNLKNLIWLYYEGNDNLDLKNELKNKILVRYLEDFDFTQNLKKKQNLIDQSIDNLIEQNMTIKRKKENKNLNFIKFIKLYNLRLKLFHQEKNEININYKNFIKILELTKKISIKNKTKLYFVYLPDIQRYKSKNYNNHNYNQIKKIINDLKIDFIDIHNEVFLKEKKPINLFAYKISRHYNVEGYKKIANKIYEMTK